MTTSSTFAIVGGGLAGAKAAEALRDNDFDEHVVLFAAEVSVYYLRTVDSADAFIRSRESLGSA